MTFIITVQIASFSRVVVYIKELLIICLSYICEQCGSSFEGTHGNFMNNVGSIYTNQIFWMFFEDQSVSSVTVNFKECIEMWIYFVCQIIGLDINRTLLSPV